VGGFAGFGFLGEILAQVALRADGVARLSGEDGGGTIVRREVVGNVGFGFLEDLVELDEVRRGSVGFC
jgi:hypothetical protein